MAEIQSKSEPDNTKNSPRFYNPYEGLESAEHKLYELPTQPEYLFHEESVQTHRSWTDNLTYYSGVGYLSGAVSGAGKGFIDGVKSFEHGDTLKLRVNRSLNSSGSNGRMWGNRFGVVGFMYAGIESGMIEVRDTDDLLNSVVAGVATGAVYKAGSGPRAAAVAGAVGGVAAGFVVAVKRLAKRYIAD